jgi:hypothetical protein
MEIAKRVVFWAAQLESDDFRILGYMSFLAWENNTYGFYNGFSLENFINRTRYLSTYTEG